MPRKKNLFQKINSVRRKVGYIKKDANVGFGSNTYAAVSHDAVIAQIRQALIDECLIITPPSVVKSRVVDTGRVTGGGNPIIRYEAIYKIVILDGAHPDEPGSVLSADIEAHAEDQGDKAPGKAMSYAVKYFILKTFNIETGENEEGRIQSEDQGRIIDTAEYARLQGLIADINKVAKDDSGHFHEAEFIAYLQSRGFQSNKMTEINQGTYPIALAALQKKLAVSKEEDVPQ